MIASVQIVGGSFQDLLGNPIAYGYLKLELAQTGPVVGASEICDMSAVMLALDASGNISVSPPQYVWPNDADSGVITYYRASVYSATGQLVWGPNSQRVLSTTSPFNVGTWVPGVVSFPSQ